MASHPEHPEKSHLGTGLIALVGGLVWLGIVSYIGYLLAAH